MSGNRTCPYFGHLLFISLKTVSVWNPNQYWFQAFNNCLVSKQFGFQALLSNVWSPNPKFSFQTQRCLKSNSQKFRFKEFGFQTFTEHQIKISQYILQVIPSGLPRNLEAAIQRYGSATYKAPAATVLDPNGKLSINLTYGEETFVPLGPGWLWHLLHYSC